MCRSFTYLVRQIEGNALDSQMYCGRGWLPIRYSWKRVGQIVIAIHPKMFFSFSAGDVWILLYSFTLPTETANLPRRGLP